VEYHGDKKLTAIWYDKNLGIFGTGQPALFTRWEFLTKNEVNDIPQIQDKIETGLKHRC